MERGSQEIPEAKLKSPAAFGSKKQKSPNKQEITQRLHIRRKQTAWQEMHRQQGNVIAKISSPHIIVRIMRKIPVGFVHSPRIKSCAYK